MVQKKEMGWTSWIIEASRTETVFTIKQLTKYNESNIKSLSDQPDPAAGEV